MLNTNNALTPLDGFKYLITKEDTQQGVATTLTRMYINFTKAMHRNVDEHLSADIVNELFYLGEFIFILNSEDVYAELDKLIAYGSEPQCIAAYLFKAYSRYSKILAKYRDEFGSDEDIENELCVLSVLIEIFNGVYEVDTNDIAA